MGNVERTQESKQSSRRLAARLELLGELYETALGVVAGLKSSTDLRDSESLSEKLEQLQRLLDSADSLSRALAVHRSELRSTASLASPRQRVLTVASELVRSLHVAMMSVDEAARKLDPDPFGSMPAEEDTAEPESQPLSSGDLI